MTDVEYTVAHTASLREHPAIQTVTYAAATGAGAEEKHYVPTRVDYTDEQLAALSGDLGQQFSRFELIRAGKKVKSLTIGSGEKLSGVHVAFEDGAEKVAGVSPVVSTGGAMQRPVPSRSTRTNSSRRVKTMSWNLPSQER